MENGDVLTVSLNIPKNTSLRTRYLTIDVLDFQFEPWPDAKKTLFQHLRWFLTQKMTHFLDHLIGTSPLKNILRCQTTKKTTVSEFPATKTQDISKKKSTKIPSTLGVSFRVQQQTAGLSNQGACQHVGQTPFLDFRSTSGRGETCETQKTPQAAPKMNVPVNDVCLPDFHAGKTHVFFFLPREGGIHGTHFSQKAGHI